jgi:hypothetical protein
MSNILRRRGQDPLNGGKESVLTAAMCLAKYITPQSLLNFIDTGRADDVDDMEKFMLAIKDRRKFDYPRKIRTDKGGLPYKYVNMNESNGQEGFKIILLDQMDQFLIDRHRGNFQIDFTLDDLVAEAENGPASKKLVL